ncbi:MAG: hypothetical protein HZC28_14685 [Spirochaetes bacterium]|nr:hypothetical protein [Spirochaetota bacterium]
MMKSMSLVKMSLLIIAGCISLPAADEKIYDASVTIDHSLTGKKVTPLLYGNNTKWLADGESHHKRDNGIWLRDGNCINPAVRDWLVDAKFRILRYGDGSNGDFFYWGWSIMPWKYRQTNEVFTRWGAGEHYTFGVMEFISLAERMGSEGLIIVNYPLGILKGFYDAEKNGDARSRKEIAIQQAVNWVEFMNMDAPAVRDPSFPDEYKPEYSLMPMPKGYFAFLRAQLGHVKPFVVKYWEIGNEVDIFHNAGGSYAAKVDKFAPISCEEYTRNAVDYAQAMKKIDPSIKVGIVEWPTGKPKKEDVARQLDILKTVPGAIDFYIVHDYIGGSGVGRNPVFAFRGSNPVTRSFTVPTTGRYQLRMHAWGRAYFGDKYPKERGVPSIMEMRIDDSPVDSIEITKNFTADRSEIIPNKFEWYEIAKDLTAGEHSVTLRMANDFYDGSMTGADRRGRDVFIDALLLEKDGVSREIFQSDRAYSIYGQTRYMEQKHAGLNDQFSAAGVPLFLAQTEGGVYPSSVDLAEAIANAVILMADMDAGVGMRTHFHLYGSCDRSGMIHSGNAEKDNYHRTPAYYTLKLFSEYFGTTLTGCDVVSPTVRAIAATSDQDGPVKEGMPLVRARSSRTENGMAVALVNCDVKRSASVRFTVRNFNPSSARMHVLTTDDPDGFRANNEKNPDNVVLRTIILKLPFEYVTLPPNSLAMIELLK